MAQANRPSRGSSNRQDSFPPQDLCSCCRFCPEYFSSFFPRLTSGQTSVHIPVKPSETVYDRPPRGGPLGGPFACHPVAPPSQHSSQRLSVGRPSPPRLSCSWLRPQNLERPWHSGRSTESHAQKPEHRALPNPVPCAVRLLQSGGTLVPPCRSSERQQVLAGNGGPPR